MPELTQQPSSDNPELTQQPSRNKKYMEVLLPEITALNADMEILYNLAVDFGSGRTNNKIELMKTLGKVRERTWIGLLLAPFVQALSGLEYTRDGLKDMLTFQHGIRPEDIQPDNKLLGMIIATTNCWRIIGPSLTQAITGKQITLSLEQFDEMLLSGRGTPAEALKRINDRKVSQRIRNLLDGGA